MEDSSPPLHDPNDLPFLPKLLAHLLSYGLGLIDARHVASWEQGRDSASRAGAEQEASAEEHSRSTTRIFLQYRDDVDHLVPGRHAPIFGEGRLNVSADDKGRMREDCASYLAADQQPSNEQWKAIFSTSQSTCISGAAGTGKTRVLLLRLIFMHCHLKVPLSQMVLLTFSRESRMGAAIQFQALLQKWGVERTLEDVLEVVKTPQSALLEQVRSLPDLAKVVPFEVLAGSTASVPQDGRPFDDRLTESQEVEMRRCFQSLYLSNKKFSELARKLFAESLLVERLEVDAMEVIRRAPIGWKLSEVDDEVCDAVEALWRRSGHWPLEGIVDTRKPHQIRSRSFSSSGYIPQLGLHVVLGFDRSEDRHIRRSAVASTELYKEVAIKRTILQAYHTTGVVHLDSYRQAKELSAALKGIDRGVPGFCYRLKGSEEAVSILQAFNSTATLIDALGLEIGTIAGRMNFLAGDLDAVFFEALGVYWQHLERHLITLPSPAYPFGRLFDLFGQKGGDNMRHLSMATLGRMRHILVDGAEDSTLPIACWIRSSLSEIHRRDLGLRGTTSLTVAGDISQAVFGSRGATTKMITNIEDMFPAPDPGLKINLTECFRSTQGVIDAAHNLVQSHGLVGGRSAQSVIKAVAGDHLVCLLPMDLERIKYLCMEGYAAGRHILVLVVGENEKKWVDHAMGAVIREDQNTGGRRIRVRHFNKAKGLEADIVFLFGDPWAGKSAWYRNQLFKLAGLSSGGNVTPADTVYEQETLKLVNLGISRARRKCFWIPNNGTERIRSASSLVSLNPSFFDDQRPPIQ